MKKQESKADIVQNTAIFAGYEEFLRELKERIQTAQVRAAVSVNQELVMLYWHTGRDISLRMRDNAWGAKVID